MKITRLAQVPPKGKVRIKVKIRGIITEDGVRWEHGKGQKLGKICDETLELFNADGAGKITHTDDYHQAPAHNQEVVNHEVMTEEERMKAFTGS